MVTIEPTSEDVTCQENPIKPNVHEENSQGLKNSEALQSNGAPRELKKGAEAEGHVDADREAEGWETASEGGMEEETPSVSAHIEDRDSYEDAMTDEEHKQRSLAQANEAKAEGNRSFTAGEYEAALAHYAKALEIAPDDPIANEVRSMCFANRAVCYYKLSKYDETVKESTKALELNPAYVKALIKRADAHEILQQFEEAIADLKKVLELEASNEQARRTIIRLEPLAAEKREKLKEEMIGKLKDLGNSVLGRFGMSVDNFKAVKDPNSGSYSISFQR